MCACVCIHIAMTGVWNSGNGSGQSVSMREKAKTTTPRIDAAQRKGTREERALFTVSCGCSLWRLCISVGRLAAPYVELALEKVVEGP